MENKKKKLLLIVFLGAILLFITAGCSKDKNSEKIEGTRGETGSSVKFEANTEKEESGAKKEEITESGDESGTSSELPATTRVQTTVATTKKTETETTVKKTEPETKSTGYYYNYAGVNPVPAKVSEKEWYLLLVNFDYCLPKGYSFEKTDVGNGIKMDSRVAPHFKNMQAAAKKDGLNIVPLSGYRSLDRQETLFNQTVNEYKGQGFDDKTSVEKASKRRQPPGCSEHNAGLAMDVCEINKNFENTAEFKWLMANAAEYGFILRYPKDKVGITRVQYEPWHWRYVGVEAAKEIMSRAICLEEYLGI